VTYGGSAARGNVSGLCLIASSQFCHSLPGRVSCREQTAANRDVSVLLNNQHMSNVAATHALQRSEDGRQQRLATDDNSGARRGGKRHGTARAAAEDGRQATAAGGV